MSGAGWLEASIEIDASQRDAAESALERQHACAIVLEDAGDRPILEPGPGETPLWPSIRLSALFDADGDRGAILLALAAALPELSPHQVAFRHIAEQDWTRAWMDRFRPMRFGRRLWVSPSHMPVPADAAVAVRLDPGLAFGTGTHATTALCLEGLDGLDLDGRQMLDFGCGSGILAIAAVKLGAASATAVDNDPQALAATLDNAARNGVLERITAVAAAQFVERRYDVVVANILAQPLIDLAPLLRACLAPGGRLLLSGILVEQSESVAAAYADAGLHTQCVEHDGWVRLDGTRG